MKYEYFTYQITLYLEINIFTFKKNPVIFASQMSHHQQGYPLFKKIDLWLDDQTLKSDDISAVGILCDANSPGEKKNV